MGHWTNPPSEGVDKATNPFSRHGQGENRRGALARLTLACPVARQDLERFAKRNAGFVTRQKELLELDLPEVALRVNPGIEMELAVVAAGGHPIEIARVQH